MSKPTHSTASASAPAIASLSSSLSENDSHVDMDCESDGNEGRNSAASGLTPSQLLSPPFPCCAPYIGGEDGTRRQETEEAIKRHGWNEQVHGRKVWVYSTFSPRTSASPYAVELYVRPMLADGAGLPTQSGQTGQTGQPGQSRKPESEEQRYNRAQKAKLRRFEEKIKVGLSILRADTWKAKDLAYWQHRAAEVRDPADRWPKVWHFSAQGVSTPASAAAAAAAIRTAEQQRKRKREAEACARPSKEENVSHEER